jgi:aquaporin rerated protein, other eukaryote
MASFLHDWQNDLAAAGFEFIGTITFLLLGLGPIQASSIARAESGSAGTSGTPINQMMYDAAGLGLALLVSAWLFYRVTGGLFNPNVSTALFAVGVIGPLRWLLFCIAQMIGAIVAAGLLKGLMPGPLSVK